MTDTRALDADPRFRSGVECFNRRAFFDAHEIWEDVWREEPAGDRRRFLQALIQIAAAYHHVQRGEGLQRGNFRGASRLFHAALGRLDAPLSEDVVPASFDLTTLVAAAQRDVDVIDDAIAIAPDDPAPSIPYFPQIRYR